MGQLFYPICLNPGIFNCCWLKSLLIGASGLSFCTSDMASIIMLSNWVWWPSGRCTITQIWHIVFHVEEKKACSMLLRVQAWICISGPWCSGLYMNDCSQIERHRRYQCSVYGYHLWSTYKQYTYKCVVVAFNNTYRNYLVF